MTAPIERRIDNFAQHEPLPQPNPVYEAGEQPASREAFIRPVGGFNDAGTLQAARTSVDGSLRTAPSDAAADAFGRARATSPASIFDNKQLYAKDTLFFDELLVNATSTHLPNEAATQLQVGTTNGDRAVRQTRQYFPYHPGQSQLLLLTGVLGEQKPGVIYRIGYFDDNDGFFFQLDNAGLAVVRRSSVTGSPVEEVIRQGQWSLDRLDGGGRSKVKLDPTKANIFIFDMAWLGVGSMRFGVQIGGRTFYCHELENENRLTTVHTANPALPLRYELVNIADTSSASAMKHICTAAFSEGATDPLGLVVSTNMGAAVKNITTARTPLLSVRSIAARPRVTLEPLSLSVFSTTAGTVEYLVELIIGATLTGDAFNPVPTSPNAEFDVAATALTLGANAVVVGSGYASKSNQASQPFQAAVESALRAAANIDASVVDAITIAITPLSGPADFLAAMTWKELF